MSLSVVRRWQWRFLSRHPKRAVLQTYWSNPPDDANQPERYAAAVERSAFLLSIMRRYVSADAHVLELGCNVGRNLSALFEAGYHHVSGVEINETAVSEMARHFPESAEQVRTIVGPIEEVIPRMRDNEYDCVFTMAVLEHLHSDSDGVFREIVRVARSVLITIEDERSHTWKHFPRRYDRVFEPLGMRQVEVLSCDAVDGLGSPFVARVFLQPGVAPVAATQAGL